MSPTYFFTYDFFVVQPIMFFRMKILIRFVDLYRICAIWLLTQVGDIRTVNDYSK